MSGFSGEPVHPRALAHLGDAVYELHVREFALRHCLHQVNALHRYTTERVNASFQVRLLHELEPLLSEPEKELIRQARNLPVSVGRRANQALYRQATGFEALIGHLHLNDRARLQALWDVMAPFLLSPAENSRDGAE